MFRKKIALSIVLVLVWLFLILFPWQPWLGSFEVVRFYLGCLIYIAPGFAAFWLVSDDKVISVRILLGGFVVSIFVTGIMGILARLFQLNFLFIRGGLAGWGVLVFALLPYQKQKARWKFEKFTWLEILLLSIAAGGVVYFIAITEPPLLHDDAFTYNALLYYFQHAPVLNFHMVPALDRMEIPRFWIAYWPLVEAVISDLGRVDGLLVAGAYLPRVLACFSFLGFYRLMRSLGLSRLLTGAAILAQGFSLMRLTGNTQPGYLFFQRITEDKAVAAFVISLIVISLVVEYLDKPSGSRLLLVGVSALAMAFTHPVQFGMTCLIIGVYGLPSLVRKDLRNKYLAMLAVLAVIALIPYMFRFGGGEYAHSLNFSVTDMSRNADVERLVRVVDIVKGTPYYGILTSLTTGLPYEVALAATLLSLFFFWKNNFARYLLAAFLVLGVSIFPYTGWIVGLFTTPSQLWRLTWLMPFGLGFAFLMWAGLEMIRKIEFLKAWDKWLVPLFFLTIYAVLVIALVRIRPMTLSRVAARNLNEVEIYHNYLSMAEKMNRLNVDMPVIIGGTEPVTNGILPSLTMKFRPLVFRVEAGGGNRSLWLSLMGDGIPVEERYNKFREYKIEYLLVKDKPEWVTEFLEKYPGHIELVLKDQKLYLYKIHY